MRLYSGVAAIVNHILTLFTLFKANLTSIHKADQERGGGLDNTPRPDCRFIILLRTINALQLLSYEF